MATMYHRMESAALREREAARRTLIESLTDIHPRSTVSAKSRILNGHGDRSHITIGADSAILGDLILFPRTGRIEIGEKCYVGEQSRIWSASSVRLGNYVLISHNVTIVDTSGHSTRWRDRRVELDQMLPDFCSVTQSDDLKTSPIVIEDDVWIGANSVVLEGLHIGRGAIVGASAVVTRSVPSFAVVAGSPAREIRRLVG